MLSSVSSKRRNQSTLPAAPQPTGRRSSQEKQPRARPFIKWAGGKQKLCSLYTSLGLFPRISGTYYEAFLGGGAVFFHLQPPKAALIDNNADLVTAYNVVKTQVHKLIDELSEHAECHRRYGASYYYEVRGEKPSKALHRAARIIYLNKTCFNGLYRVNGAGEFNVPMGDYKNPRIVDERGLLMASRALRSARVRHGDYSDVEDLAEPGDFVYFDPPYDPLHGKTSFTAYTKTDFGPLDQSNLRDVFKRLADKGVKALVSNSDTPRIRDLYDDWWIHNIPAPRSINSVGAARGSVNELAITNFKVKPLGTLDAFG